MHHMHAITHTHPYTRTHCARRLDDGRSPPPHHAQRLRPTRTPPSQQQRAPRRSPTETLQCRASTRPRPHPARADTLWGWRGAVKPINSLMVACRSWSREIKNWKQGLFFQKKNICPPGTSKILSAFCSSDYSSSNALKILLVPGGRHLEKKRSKMTPPGSQTLPARNVSRYWGPP